MILGYADDDRQQDRAVPRLFGFALDHLGWRVGIKLPSGCCECFRERVALAVRNEDEAPGPEPAMVGRGDRSLHHEPDPGLVGARSHQPARRDRAAAQDGLDHRVITISHAAPSVMTERLETERHAFFYHVCFGREESYSLGLRHRPEIRRGAAAEHLQQWRA
jgi:hypothetical protein